jgi:hypothetical protein
MFGRPNILRRVTLHEVIPVALGGLAGLVASAHVRRCFSTRVENYPGPPGGGGVAMAG